MALACGSYAKMWGVCLAAALADLVPATVSQMRWCSPVVAKPSLVCLPSPLASSVPSVLSLPERERLLGFCLSWATSVAPTSLFSVIPVCKGLSLLFVTDSAATWFVHDNASSSLSLVSAFATRLANPNASWSANNSFSDCVRPPSSCGCTHDVTECRVVQIRCLPLTFFFQWIGARLGDRVFGYPCPAVVFSRCALSA